MITYCFVVKAEMDAEMEKLKKNSQSIKSIL